MSWIVIYTKPSQEFRAKDNLKALGATIFLPLRSKEKVANGSFVVCHEPLFPRYIFMRNDGALLHKISHMLRSTRGVSSVVNFGGKFAELSDEMVSSMKAAEGRSLSQPEKAYRRGDEVNFTFGPFKNIEAAFKESDGVRRIILLFDLLGKPTTMSVPLRSIKKNVAV